MMSRINRYMLSIAGISLLMETEQPLKREKAFLPFIIEETVPDIEAHFCQVEQLPSLPGEVIHDGNGGYVYSYFDAPKDTTPYAAVTYDLQKEQIRVEYLKKGTHCVSEMRNSFLHLNFEDVLIRRNRIFFHAACVQTFLGGILFSGRGSTRCSYRGGKGCNGPSAHHRTRSAFRR